jgi:hypothetical protein
MNIIHMRRDLTNEEKFLEYDVKNPGVNRKFLEFQVKVILNFFKAYVKNTDIDSKDEEAIFMHMYTNSDIMKVFRDEYGALPDETVKKWTDKDINRTTKALHKIVKVK